MEVKGIDKDQLPCWHEIMHPSHQNDNFFNLSIKEDAGNLKMKFLTHSKGQGIYAIELLF